MPFNAGSRSRASAPPLRCCGGLARRHQPTEGAREMRTLQHAPVFLDRHLPTDQFLDEIKVVIELALRDERRVRPLATRRDRFFEIDEVARQRHPWMVPEPHIP